VEQLSTEQQMQQLREKKAVEDAVNQKQYVIDKNKEYWDQCLSDSYRNVDGWPLRWRGYTINSRDSIGDDCRTAADGLAENMGSGWRGDGIGQDWTLGGDAGGVWW
jgi:hypothetical protein